VIERTVASDPRLADYRLMSDADLVKRRGLFVAETRLVVTHVIERMPAAVRSVLVNEAAYRGLEAILATLPAHVPVFVCAAADFPIITGFNFHRGCLAIVERPRELTAAEIIERSVSSPSTDRSADSSRYGTLIVLEGVTNADNVGAVFRDAAAFRAGGVLLDPATCDPLYRKAIRTSTAAVLRVPFARVDPWPSGLDRLRERRISIVALTPREPSVTIDAFASARPDRIALLVGTEGTGLTPAAEAAADCRVRIPIASDVDSLNLAVAVGIALHRLASVNVGGENADQSRGDDDVGVR